MTARSNTGIMGFRPPCDRCRQSGNSDECELANGVHTPTCSQCQQSKIKCTFSVLMVVMERSASGEKRKQSEKTVEVEMLPRGGEKWKRTKKAIVDAASTEEIEVAMGGVLGGWAIKSARPNCAGLGPLTRGDRGGH